MEEIERIIITVDWIGSEKDIPKSISVLDSFYSEKGEGFVAFIENIEKEDALTILEDLLKIVNEDNYFEVTVLNSKKGYSIYINEEIEKLKERMASNG